MKNEEIEKAVAFAQSYRGQYIIGQALYTAIETMKKVPAPRTEVSNIKDMEYLMDNLFPIFKAVQSIKDAVKLVTGEKDGTGKS